MHVTTKACGPRWDKHTTATTSIDLSKGRGMSSWLKQQAITNKPICNKEHFTEFNSKTGERERERRRDVTAAVLVQ
jgi:hypothetical protein